MAETQTGFLVERGDNVVFRGLDSGEILPEITVTEAISSADES